MGKTSQWKASKRFTLYLSKLCSGNFAHFAKLTVGFYTAEVINFGLVAAWSAWQLFWQNIICKWLDSVEIIIIWPIYFAGSVPSRAKKATILPSLKQLKPVSTTVSNLYGCIPSWNQYFVENLSEHKRNVYHCFATWFAEGKFRNFSCCNKDPGAYYLIQQ